MNYFPAVRLDRNHIPIHPKCFIRNQDQYDNHMAMLQYLYQQVDLGFKPKWMISIHYKHPSEKERNVPEMYKGKDGLPKTRWGRKIIQKGQYNPQSSLWHQVAEYQHQEDRRNDRDLTEDDNKHLKNLLLKKLFGINKRSQTWKPNYPKNLLFILEKGKVKLQYHLHILLPEIVKQQNTDFYQTLQKSDIQRVLNSNREKARCLSTWKRMHVEEIDNPHNAISYLNKETTGTHCSLDDKNSILITR
tara:strand:+ start:641 stop:1378 length:738 start_codon:yes stop_codon:yes gene_type:complete